jgi:hypothetical protein
MFALGAVLLGVLARGKRAPFDAPSPHGEGARERIVSLAWEYLNLWRNSGADARAAIVESIWDDAVGTPYQREPWSAAFVTHVVNTAAPRALFRSAKHSIYTAKALRGFGEYRVLAYFDSESEIALQPGDLVLKPRPGEPPPTFEQFETGDYLSHADIVVEVNPTDVVTIGANKTGGGVGVERYPLGPNGAPLPPVFAVLLLDAPAVDLTKGADGG